MYLREQGPGAIWGLALWMRVSIARQFPMYVWATEFRHKRRGKCWMLESVRCDHCEEDFAPEELVILDPPAGHGELICARCIEIMFRRAIAKLPRGDN